MQTIDASNNIISSLDEKAFAPVIKSIKHIRLNRNNINDIAPNTFAKLKSIEQIEMRNNQLEHLKKLALSIVFRRQEGKDNCNYFNPIQILMAFCGTILI